jgi:hypothetical protein
MRASIRCQNTSGAKARVRELLDAWAKAHTYLPDLPNPQVLADCGESLRIPASIIPPQKTSSHSVERLLVGPAPHDP